MDDSLRQQFEEAFDKYADSIFRFLVLKTKNRHAAIDLTQDAYIKTWEYMTQGNTIENIRAFLYKVAHNLWLSSLRTTTRETSLDDLIEQGWQPVDEYDVEEDATQSERHKEVLSRLQELDENYQTVLTLRYIEELSIEEISNILDESPNTISVRIHRAKQKLKDLYT